MSPPGAPLPLQRNLTDQMGDLHAFALKAGMREAAGWLERHFPWAAGHGHCCPPDLKVSDERVQRILAEELPR